MFGIFKKKYLIRLLLNIRSAETYNPLDNPEGLPAGGIMYYDEYYLRLVEIDYPPIKGMTFSSPCKWWGYHPIDRIMYHEGKPYTDCWLEDLVIEHDTLVENFTDIELCLAKEGWRKANIDDDSLAESIRW